MRIRLFVLALASCAAFASAGNAETRSHHHHYRQHVASAAAGNEVIVKKRSFLDSGVVVPVGSRQSYMVQSKVYNSMPGINNRANFTEDLLPGPLGQPAGMPGFQN